MIKKTNNQEGKNPSNSTKKGRASSQSKHNQRAKKNGPKDQLKRFCGDVCSELKVQPPKIHFEYEPDLLEDLDYYVSIDCVDNLMIAAARYCETTDTLIISTLYLSLDYFEMLKYAVARMLIIRWMNLNEMSEWYGDFYSRTCNAGYTEYDLIDALADGLATILVTTRFPIADWSYDRILEYNNYKWRTFSEVIRFATDEMKDLLPAEIFP